MTNDGTHTYTWDRANRMLSMGDTSYQYDGAGNRIAQTVDSVVTKYLLDTQPGLVVALAQTTNGQTTRFMHSLIGIHAYENSAGNWSFPLQDGLGSVLNEVDLADNVLAARRLDPYGNVISVDGTFTATYEYTGEMKDSNGLLHLRARNYSPSLGVFASLDSWEGSEEEPLTLNLYSYVGGNPINNVDPTGMIFWDFQSNLPRQGLYNPLNYSTNTRIVRAYGHVWIERWMEQANGFWQTVNEFPGGRASSGDAFVDVIVFDQGSLGTSPLDFQTPTTGSIYEIEPVIPLKKIFEGYIEVNARLTSLQYGAPHINLRNALLGNIPPDRWFPARGFGYVGSRYNFSRVNWKLGDKLHNSDIFPRGPIRVDPNLLEPVASQLSIPEAYWIILPIDGLILYETETRLQQFGVSLVASAVGTFLLNRYIKARSGRYSGLPAPKPIPGLVPQPATSSLPDSPDCILAIEIGGACVSPAVPILAGAGISAGLFAVDNALRGIFGGGMLIPLYGGGGGGKSLQ